MSRFLNFPVNGHRFNHRYAAFSHSVVVVPASLLPMMVMITLSISLRTVGLLLLNSSRVEARPAIASVGVLAFLFHFVSATV